MTMHIEAVYEHGVLRPVSPLDLAEGERVELTLVATSATRKKRLTKRERDAKDLEIINRHADRLNEEAIEALSYQAEM